jgi:hypothetical protein
MIRDIFGESSDDEDQQLGAKDAAETGDKDDISGNNFSYFSEIGSDEDIEQEAKETLKKLAKKRDKKRKKKFVIFSNVPYFIRSDDGEEKPRKKRVRKEVPEEGEPGQVKKYFKIFS